MPINEFRKQCREFAQKWIDVQREEFKRLGVEGDWDNPYLTMAYEAEAVIVAEIGKFLMNGGLYRGSKPVMWSVVEKTALAEAEIEYHDHTSDTIWVRFPIVSSPVKELAGASIVIWTTTPWTIPGNRALATGAAIDYVLLEVKSVADGAKAKVGDKLVVAEALMADFQNEIGVTGSRVAWRGKGADLVGTATHHPLNGQGYDFTVKVWPGDFVTTEAGTGFVHIAPGHGTDDYELGLANNVEMPQTVGPDGRYYDHVPLFAGKAVLNQRGKAGDANPAVIAALDAAGKLLKNGKLVHSYPHSWRSKAPLIFRNTPQWFISMATNGLREVALKAIDETRFVPPQGKTRLHSMIAQRPDWVHLAPARLGRADRDLRQQEERRAAARSEGDGAHRRCLPRAKAPMRGSTRRRRASSATTTIRTSSSRSRTSSTSGSIPARPTPSAWSRARTRTSPGRPTSISKARTSIAAGSIPRCWNPAARAAARPTRRW